MERTSHEPTSELPRPREIDCERCSQEQARIAKTGLEMKLITSEMDAETDKWTEAQNAAAAAAATAGGGAGGASTGGAAGSSAANASPSALDENNDIVKRARNMSSMAFSMYQFTRGEGTLKTTQDLFTQVPARLSANQP